VGVGSGSFLKFARDQGYNPIGCDLSAAICRRAELRSGVPVHCGSLESLPETQKFDVVVMDHLIEHVARPVHLLKTARHSLKSGGVLHVATPNVSSWEARLSGWNSYEPYHLLFFTPETLRVAVEMAGFQVQSLVTHESFSGWFLAALRTAVRTARGEARTGQSGPASTRSRLVEHVYRVTMVAFGLVTLPLRRLQGLLKKGDEVVIVARRISED
jgi:2-polyprenyl-3-methyl-5-hydroxy-6-metoxy-1,4-benzoquinol methylase